MRDDRNRFVPLTSVRLLSVMTRTGWFMFSFWSVCFGLLVYWHLSQCWFSLSSKFAEFLFMMLFLISLWGDSWDINHTPAYY